MNSYEVRELNKSEFPALLKETPSYPKRLWAVGNLPSPLLPLLAVVGSRQHTNYGRQVVEYLIAGLAPYDVGIVSGLAIGIDGLAHESALKSNLYTLAVPGSGLNRNVLYPRSHQGLAEKIIMHGGGLLSELEPDSSAAKWTFPARNRIMAGMCQGTLLIEAGEQSGTLITARLTTDYNRELMVVPGNIFSATSSGTHQFLKLGASPVTCAEDIVEILKLEPKNSEARPLGTVSNTNLPPQVQSVLIHLNEPRDRDTLIRLLKISPAEANSVLMQLEIEGHIKFIGGQYFVGRPVI